MNSGATGGSNILPAKRGAPRIFEAAIREAVTSLPAGFVPRLVLISDGNENAGSITRATWQAQHLAIPIDTIPLEGRSQAELAPGIRESSDARIHAASSSPST